MPKTKFFHINHHHHHSRISDSSISSNILDAGPPPNFHDENTFGQNFPPTFNEPITDSSNSSSSTRNSTNSDSGNSRRGLPRTNSWPSFINVCVFYNFGIFL